MEDGGGGYPELGLPPDGPGTIVSWDVTPAPQAGLGWRTENLSKAEVNTLWEKSQTGASMFGKRF